MPPIRIVHVMPQIAIGGAQLQLQALIVHSDPAEMHHEVLYYSDSKDQECLRAYRESNISFARVPRHKLRPLRFVRDLGRAIREQRPDIVHCWLYSGVVWGRFGAMAAGVRRIIVAHRGTGLLRVGILRWIERLTGHRVRYLANSRACACVVAEQIGVPAEAFDVVYNGIDFERYRIPSDRDGLLRELSIPDDQKLVLSVGRLTEAKDYPMLLRAARRCRGRVPARFLIAGHGELETELRGLAHELGVTDIVHFLGLRRDIPRLLRSCDLFCMTSSREGFPNALLEAMAAGRPVVTTDFPGADEVVRRGVDGVMVRSGDDASLSDALAEMLGAPERAAAMGEHAAVRARETFSMEAMVRNTWQCYQSLLEGRGSCGARPAGMCPPSTAAAGSQPGSSPVAEGSSHDA